MIVHLDASSPVPIFEQLRSQIERLIVSGQLAAGTKLPAIRHLAADLGVARGTVAKVYDELARSGLVVTSGRHGTIVQAVSNSQVAMSDLDDAATSLAIVAHQLGLDLPAAQLAVDRAWLRTRNEGRDR